MRKLAPNPPESQFFWTSYRIPPVHYFAAAAGFHRLLGGEGGKRWGGPAPSRRAAWPTRGSGPPMQRGPGTVGARSRHFCPVLSWIRWSPLELTQVRMGQRSKSPPPPPRAFVPEGLGFSDPSPGWWWRGETAGPPQQSSVHDRLLRIITGRMDKDV
eukprot:gene11295-biopygen309